ncbi:MAG: hypothetical protein GXP28_06060 [Planctomycetes bacterium]|nr:hypothetical protein [Planctomycetota bacterium]
MSLLIDGYNLLHVTDIFGKGNGPGGFQRSREALLRFLAASIEPAHRKQTTIVFDANHAPPGLPDTTTQEEMLVLYARDYPDADTLIEELIEKHDAPRSLLVVSSDHRIQRAARRRRAKFSDSDLWYAKLWQQRVSQRAGQNRRTPEKPIGKLSTAEIDYWVHEFGADALTDEDSPKRPTETDETRLESPFPPGYGEDLLS